MEPERQLWCLHGNLQLPSVWGSLTTTFTDRSITVESVDLWETLAPTCWDWAQQFCHEVTQTTPSGLPRPYLLGYSMGGRLALHAVLQQPDLWAGAMIVAADPGLSDLGERADCLGRDRTWGQRFLTEPWEHVLADWDAQPIFGEHPNPCPRDLDRLSRDRICQAFDTYSKGRQDDLRLKLTQLSHPPILYVTGARDSKYTALGVELASTCPTLSHRVIPQAGHRVPWESPAAFYQCIEAFILA
ncbi:MAG: alpha/beta fold hydrolase [Cyanobacteria bacterium P01_G01_bin.38]